MAKRVKPPKAPKAVPGFVRAFRPGAVTPSPVPWGAPTPTPHQPIIGYGTPYHPAPAQPWGLSAPGQIPFVSTPEHLKGT